MMTNITKTLDIQQYNLTQIYPICPICSASKTGCCLQPICFITQQDFICYNCQNNCRDSVHFLHEIIQLRSFCLDVDINYEQKKILQFQNQIEQKFNNLKKVYKRQIYRDIQKYDDGFELNIILNRLKKYKNKTIINNAKRKHIYNKLKDYILRGKKDSLLVDQLQRIKSQLMKLKSQELNLIDLQIFAQKIINFSKIFPKYNQHVESLLYTYLIFIQKAQSKRHSFHNKKLIQEEQMFKQTAMHDMLPQIHHKTRQLIFEYPNHYDFGLFPKQIIKLTVKYHVPDYRHINTIIFTKTIKQLQIELNSELNRKQLKQTYKLILSIRQLRFLTVISDRVNRSYNQDAYQFGFNHKRLVKKTYFQIQKIHLLKLYKSKRSIRSEILQFLL